MTDEPKLTVVTPVFDRPAGDPKPAVPPNAEFFTSLRDLDGAALKELGLRRWNTPSDDDATPGEFDGGTLWLFPGEWYDAIPDGFEIVDVFGLTEAFKRGETDDDIRYGVLPYGIVVAAREGRG